MSSASSSIVRVQVGESQDGARRTYKHVWKGRRDVVWLVDYYGLEAVRDRIGRATRTDGDDRLEVDDCIGEGGAVEGLELGGLLRM